MKIEQSLAVFICKLAAQIESKKNISIGYSCPYGSFINTENDFIIYDTNESYEAKKSYIIEYNPEDHAVSDEFSFMCKYKPSNLDEKTPRIELFLKNLNEWIENQEIIIYEDRYFKRYIWKPYGDGRFSIKVNDKSCQTSFAKTLDELDNRYSDLKEHILQEMQHE